MSAKQADRPNNQAPQEHSSFFESHPTKWTIISFLNHSKHPRKWDSHRKVLDAWTKELNKILLCNTDEHNHKTKHRQRAQTLMKRYKEAGSADRRYGSNWIKSQKSEPRRPEPAAPPVQSTTVNFAPVFQNGGSAAFFQNGGIAPVYHNQPNTAVGDCDDDDSNWLPPLPSRADDGYDHDVKIDSDNSEIPPPHIEAFDSAYRKTEGRRWSLPGGRDVETVLYNNFYEASCKGFYANLARSFILDLGEEDTDDDNDNYINVCKGWFSDLEWADIKATTPKLSQSAVIPLFKSLDRYDGLRSEAEFRHRVSTTHFLSENEIYVRDLHYDLWSADLAVQYILGHWEDPNQPLRTPQLEESLSSALWTPLIDHPLRGLLGVQMVHKESCCKSTASRKCRNRTEASERQASGPKIDGIIRSIEDDSLEYGSMEVSKSWGGVGGKSTKRLGDIGKVIKTLRDILFQLHERVQFNPDVTKNIQVVGIVCCGLKVQFLRMYSKGHIAILKREAIEMVPIECSNFKRLKRLITKFAMIKNVIAQSVATVRECHKTSGTVITNQSDEARLDALLSESTKGYSGPKLGIGSDTPPPGW